MKENDSNNINIRTNDELIFTLRKAGRLASELNQKFKIIDLFSGAGGLTLGFTESFGHSFRPIWANDFNEYAVNTYNKNFGNHCLPGDIVEIIQNGIEGVPKADVVIGGPPCQGFSLLNKNRMNDPRKQLWRPYLKIVSHSEAQIFVMENVPQLLGSDEYQEIIDAASELGFKTTSAILCAADYGAAQTRQRAFIVGCKYVDPKLFFPPKKTHYRPLDVNKAFIVEKYLEEHISHAEVWRTVRDAIGDLPLPQGAEIRDIAPPLNLHFGRTPTKMSIQRYKAIPKEGMNRFDLQRRAPELTPDCWIRKTKGGTDLFGRLWWNRPAFTIRTEFFKPEKGRYLHPTQHRPITHREAARLQSFPDSFEFTGTKIEIARQIGNAVPPVLAARVADSILAMLLSRDVKNGRRIFENKTKANNVKNQGAQYKTGKKCAPVYS